MDLNSMMNKEVIRLVGKNTDDLFAQVGEAFGQKETFSIEGDTNVFYWIDEEAHVAICHIPGRETWAITSVNKTVDGYIYPAQAEYTTECNIQIFEGTNGGKVIMFNSMVCAIAEVDEGIKAYIYAYSTDDTRIAMNGIAHGYACSGFSTGIDQPYLVPVSIGGVYMKNAFVTNSIRNISNIPTFFEYEGRLMMMIGNIITPF